MDDFLGMGLIIKEQRAEIERLRIELQEAKDLAMFNDALAKTFLKQLGEPESPWPLHHENTCKSLFTHNENDCDCDQRRAPPGERSQEEK